MTSTEYCVGLCDHNWLLKPCWDGWPVLWVELLTCSQVVKKWMFNRWVPLKVNFWHAWLNLNWMLSLHSGFTMDYWQCWGFILDLFGSGTMVSEFGSGQSALFLVYDSGWCNPWAYYIYDNTGWADRLIHSDLLTGSNARWCVENCPLVSRLWLSLPRLSHWPVRCSRLTCHCQALVTVTGDRLTTRLLAVSGVRPLKVEGVEN